MTSNGALVATENNLDDYDDLDDYTYKDPPKLPRRYAPGEIAASRDALFEQGSDFKPIKREDIIGIDNILVEIDQIIHWLKHSAEYQQYGSRLEPGVIFEGRPGTGKTLVSRYIATESGAIFINIRDFEHEGSLYRDSDIADLFNRARAKYAETQRPIVLFWDEFEGAAVNREEAEPQQMATVSQLTAELDGVHGKNEGILLVGCTNYIYNIDPALRRAGRMGLQIEFHAPDREGKKMILAHYLNAYKLKGDIDVETLSYCFDEYATAADIEEACVEAWRNAVQRIIDNNDTSDLTQADLLQVFLKRLVGPPTSFINLPPEDLHRIAVHECGHAIMACAYDIPLRLVTVHPGKKSLGRVMTAEIREHISTIDEMIAQARICVGSLAAESAAGLPALVNSSEDIRQVNEIVVKLVTDLNAGKRTGLYNGQPSGQRSDDGRASTPSVSVDSMNRRGEDIDELLHDIQKDAEWVMSQVGSEALHAIAAVVVDKVTMTGKEFRDEFSKIIRTETYDDPFAHLRRPKDPEDPSDTIARWNQKQPWS